MSWTIRTSRCSPRCPRNQASCIAQAVIATSAIHDFPLTKLRNIGVNVCLGTDSLASTLTLSMFDEMRILARQEPQLDPSEIIKMATLNGAMALGIEAGKIVPGALADLIALPHADNTREVHAAVIENREPVAWMMLDGKILSQ